MDIRDTHLAAQLETPQDSLLEGLHVETFVPADNHTRTRCGSSAEPAPGGVSIRRRPSGRVPSRFLREPGEGR